MRIVWIYIPSMFQHRGCVLFCSACIPLGRGPKRASSAKGPLRAQYRRQEAAHRGYQQRRRRVSYFTLHGASSLLRFIKHQPHPWFQQNTSIDGLTNTFSVHCVLLGSHGIDLHVLAVLRGMVGDGLGLRKCVMLLIVVSVLILAFSVSKSTSMLDAHAFLAWLVFCIWFVQGIGWL